MAEIVPADFVARVAERLAARRAEKSNVSVSRPAYDALYETAAVLSWFDPGKLSPVEETNAQDRVNKLVADSTQTFDESGARRWTLLPDVRVKVLAQLRASGRVREVLENIKDHPEDDLQRALVQWLIGTPTPLEEQSLEALGASFQVCEWLRQAGFEELPDKESIQRQIDWLTLLQPFEHLAGEFFRGRVAELQTLRDYVGVLPPGSAFGATRRFVEEIFNFKDKPPLIIYGPGGVGKSTLVAKFILDHARAFKQDQFPFAYLDFDRPDLESQEPLTLLAEAVKQLGIEYPQARESCDRIRQAWLQVLADFKPDANPEAPSKTGWRVVSAAVRDFSTLIDSLGAQDRPVLFVLDTFEEVQFRSEQQVAAIWRLLEELQAAVTRLRVVIVGRGNIIGRKTNELRLKGLDEEAAIGYLQARGITDRQIAQRIANQLGGSPLSLQLAVEVFELEGLDQRGSLNVNTRNIFLSRMDNALIQRQLYTRILGHVHDDEVRRLVHPGLVLRRLTPQLILQVLAEPCDLKISSLDEAQLLFDKLKREVSLVVLAPDGALEHRQDLRQIMLGLVQAAEPEKANDIHRRAADYYEQQSTTPQRRAEEIYHRLASGQKLSVIRPRWLNAVTPFLTDALPEFHGPQLAFLAARLKVEVDPETLQVAELEDWERIIERKTRELLSQDRPEDAIKLLTSRTERTKQSPLFSLQARALKRVRRYAEALVVLNEGIHTAVTVGDRKRELSLTLQAIEIILVSGYTQNVQQIIGRMGALAVRPLPVADQLNVFAHLSALLHLVSSPASLDYTSYVDESLRIMFDDVSDTSLVRRPQIARWATLSFGRADVSRLSRVLRLTGLPRVRERLWRHLAAALTSLDIDISQQRGNAPGALARELDLTFYGSVTESWTRFVLKERNKQVAEVICRLLDNYVLSFPERIIDAVINVMRSSLGLDPTEVEEVHTETDLAARYDYRINPRSLKLTREEHARIVDAIASAFSTAELSELLMVRFDRRLESITRPNSNLKVMVMELIATAEMQGWLTDLIAKAHESRPGNAALAEVAERLGLSILSSSDIISSITHDPGRFLDPTIWRERLGGIEAQVCRIEIRNQAVGTGFLVGVDLVLTANHVLERLYTNKAASAELQVRFDYKVDPSGHIVTAGTVFGLDKDWLVARREYGQEPNQLGYAILRVINSPGAQPIGDTNAEASAALRRWIEVTERTSFVQPGDGLIMVHRPEAGPLQLSMDSKAVVALSPDKSRIYYTLNTVPGSSGAPCFNFDFDLVAFHIGQAPYVESAVPKGTGVGVLMTAVLRDLKELELEDLLGTRFV
jgi:hypothetical protein